MIGALRGGQQQLNVADLIPEDPRPNILQALVNDMCRGKIVRVGRRRDRAKVDRAGQRNAGRPRTAAAEARTTEKIQRAHTSSWLGVFFDAASCQVFGVRAQGPGRDFASANR